MNLVGNSIKYSKNGTIIIVAQNIEADLIEISVIDDG